MGRNEILKNLFDINNGRGVGSLLMLPDDTTPPHNIILTTDHSTLTYLTFQFGHYTMTIVKSDGSYAATLLNKAAFDILKMVKI